MYIYIYIYVYIYIYIYIYIHTYILLFLSHLNGLFCQSIHFDLLDSYRRSLFAMLNECARRVKDSDI